jgi:hypothetical protein
MVLLSAFMIEKRIGLPLARDKHRGNSKKGAVFLQSNTIVRFLALKYGPALHGGCEERHLRTLVLC